MAVGAAALVAGPAWARDGAIEINQAAALAGIGPGDPAGFPVVLTTPGGHVLTGSLVVPAGFDGIRVDADDVTLDLNGFDVVGPTVCTGFGTTLSCPPATTGDGIDLQGENLLVRDGSIRGFARGLAGGPAAQDLTLDGVTVRSNSGAGILLGSGSASTRLFDTIVAGNGGDPSGSADGASLPGGLFLGSRFAGNLGHGLEVNSPALVIGSVFESNLASGFRCNDRCLLLGSKLLGNFFGGFTGSPAAFLFYGQNVFQNTSTNVTGAGGVVEMGTNMCGTDATCP